MKRPIASPGWRAEYDYVVKPFSPRGSSPACVLCCVAQPKPPRRKKREALPRVAVPLYIDAETRRASYQDTRRSI